MASPVPKLFQPIQVGTANLQHRVVLAPMKRARADGQNVLGGAANVPGIWSDEQIAAWKTITDAVHANGSSIYLQLWVLGRVAEGDVLRKAGGYEVVAPSAIALEGHETPRPLTVAEIKEYVQLYASAAENAVLQAGFDGVEVQVTGGYLPDQFLQPATNTRTDEYGGSLENRLRFVLEVTDAVVKAVGANKVGLRVSPYLTIQGMGMPDPIPTYTKLVTSIRDSYPDFAYLHVIEITHIVGPRDTAIEVVEKEGGLVAFGRYFISNPDLPRRLKENIELALDNPVTWWTQGAEGYTDYPFATEISPGV
ncbi:hypothetical protein EDB85DRAFT_2145853 [Lactarius pseudohatsudake]|nr:hypothetical protein EDB85DRAFT_2145853 [Lactarius pseudohatsudake]